MLIFYLIIKTYQTKWDSHLCFGTKQFSKCFRDLPTSNHPKVCFMIQMLRMTTFASKTLCHALNLSKIEAPLARVRRVRPSPSIIKEGLSNLSIFGHKGQNFINIWLRWDEREVAEVMKKFGTPWLKSLRRPWKAITCQQFLKLKQVQGI